MTNAIQRVAREITHQDPPVPITYVEGDATEPIRQGGSDMTFLVHCCNDVGAWGSGFVMAINQRWASPSTAYHNWRYGIDTIYRTTGPFQLGEVQFVQVPNGVVVCNLIGQHSVVSDPAAMNPSGIPVRYEAIELGLAKIRLAMLGATEAGWKPTFHSPMFGADRAGGDWKVVEGCIQRVMCATGIACTVYKWRG